MKIRNPHGAARAAASTRPIPTMTKEIDTSNPTKAYAAANKRMILAISMVSDYTDSGPFPKIGIDAP